jgi:hypothetical protein
MMAASSDDQEPPLDYGDHVLDVVEHLEAVQLDLDEEKGGKRMRLNWRRMRFSRRIVSHIVLH